MLYSLIQHYNKNFYRFHDPLGWLLPYHCGLCRSEIAQPGTLCPTCWTNIEFHAPPCCQACGLIFEYELGSYCLECLRAPPRWKNFAAAVQYTSESAALITQFKYHRLTLLPLLANWLKQAAIRLPNPDYLVPMPLNRLRLFQRRFNQSALLAQRLAVLRETPKQYVPMLLQRVGFQPPQKKLSAHRRRSNVRNTFRLKLKSPTQTLIGKRIWLIDDVATTGASLSEASRILTEAGAEVDVLVLARVHGRFPNIF